MKAASSMWFHGCSVRPLEIQFTGVILFRVVQEYSTSPWCPFSAPGRLEFRAGSFDLGSDASVVYLWSSLL